MRKKYANQGTNHHSGEKKYNIYQYQRASLRSKQWSIIS